jgi:hypothetical protein
MMILTHLHYERGIFTPNQAFTFREYPPLPGKCPQENKISFCSNTFKYTVQHGRRAERLATMLCDFA